MIRKLFTILFLFLSVPCWGATTQVLISGSANDLDAAAIEYITFYGSGGNTSNTLWNSSEAQGQTVIPTDGILDDLRVILQNDPALGVGVQSFTFTLRVAGAGTTLGCTVSEGGTSCTDSDGVSVTAGQLIAFESAPANTPTVGDAFWTATWTPTTSDKSIFMGGTGSNALATLGTEYLAIPGVATPQTTSFDMEMVVPTGGVLRDLYISLNTDPGTGTTRVFTVTGDAGSFACTVTGGGGSNLTCNNTSDTITISAGETYVISSTVTGTPTASAVHYGLVFDPTTEGEWIIAHSSFDNMNDTTTEYRNIAGSGGVWISTELDRRQLAQAFTIKNFYVEASGLAGAGNSYVYTPRKGIADMSATFTCTTDNTNVQCNDTESITISNDDLLSFEVVPVSIPTIRDATYSFTGFLAPTGARRIMLVQ